MRLEQINKWPNSMTYVIIIIIIIIIYRNCCNIENNFKSFCR